MRKCPTVLRRPASRYERFIEVAGLRGCYTDVGVGPVVVILATTLARGRSYQWTIDCLAPHFRVVTVEMPGCGRGSEPPGRWGFEDYAGWVVGFLDALGLPPPTLIGHSNSGGTAMVAAALYPGRVGRVVLVDTVGGYLDPSVARVILGRGIDAFIEMRLTLFGWHHVFYNALFHPVSFFRQVWLSVYQDLRPYLAKVGVPTLIAWGARDYTLPPRCADALRAARPNTPAYISSEGSHDWLIERAPEFAAVLRAFVEATEAGVGPLSPRDSPASAAS